MKSEYEDELRYGLVLTRLPDDEWWHGWLVRSNLLYDCELLGRRTTMLFLMQKFARGVVARSPAFFLTLDAEGIGDPEGVRHTADWGESAGTGDEKARALAIRRSILPALADNPAFQRAAWFVVDHAEHETTADADRMTRIVTPPFLAE
jgi:hypothetical protein